MASGPNIPGILELAAREAAEIVWARKVALELIVASETTSVGVLVAFERAHAGAIGRLTGFAFALELVDPVAGKAEDIRDELLGDFGAHAWDHRLTAGVADASTLERLAAIPAGIEWSRAVTIAARTTRVDGAPLRYTT